jgi:hypothetical protein
MVNTPLSDTEFEQLRSAFAAQDADELAAERMRELIGEL